MSIIYLDKEFDENTWLNDKNLVAEWYIQFCTWNSQMLRFSLDEKYTLICDGTLFSLREIIEEANRRIEEEFNEYNIPCIYIVGSDKINDVELQQTDPVRNPDNIEIVFWDGAYWYWRGADNRVDI